MNLTSKYGMAAKYPKSLQRMEKKPQTKMGRPTVSDSISNWDKYTARRKVRGGMG